MAKENKKKGGGVKKAIKAAGPTISKSEFDAIVKAAGGNTKKALNKISKQGGDLKSATANMLIRQQQQTPTYLGESSIAQDVYSRADAGSLLTRGTTLSPTKKGKYKETVPSSSDPYDVSKQPQDFSVADAILAASEELRGARSGATQESAQPAAPAAPAGPDYNSIMAPFLEMIAASTAASQQQMADLNAMMTAGLANSQAMFQQQMDQNLALAEQEKAANRAFMINSGRQTSPANLQLGIGYNQNKLAGTEGFKYRPKQVTAAPIAFSSPTLAASAASQVPTVINV